MQIITLALLFGAAISLAVTWWGHRRDMLYIDRVSQQRVEKGHALRIACREKGVILNEDVL